MSPTLAQSIGASVTVGGGFANASFSPLSGTAPGSGALGGMGIPSGQILLTQADDEDTFEPDFYYYPDEEPRTPEAWGRWKIAQNESEAIVRRFLDDALMMRTGKTTQYRKSGGFVQANTDFDRITSDWSLAVRNQGNGIRSTTLPNGTTISVRPESGEGSPTIQINVPGQAKIKIRY